LLRDRKVSERNAGVRCNRPALSGRSSIATRRSEFARLRRGDRAPRLQRERLFPAGNLLQQRFEARIAAKWIEQWIYFDERNVESSVVVAALQFIDGVRSLA
jgi:hypothetical protein